MNLEKMLEHLNHDLANEYKHHRFYLHASFVLKGMSRLYLGPWLKNQAQEELDHIEEFASKIVALGGQPTVGHLNFPFHMTDPESILQYALSMEKEVVATYQERIKHAEELHDHTKEHYDLVLLYEEQIEDSQHDIDEILKLVGCK